MSVCKLIERNKWLVGKDLYSIDDAMSAHKDYPRLVECLDRAVSTNESLARLLPGDSGKLYTREEFTDYIHAVRLVLDAGIADLDRIAEGK